MSKSVIETVEAALVDVDYPATKDELVEAAARNGADEEALRALRAMPPVDYRNRQEVLQSVDVHPADGAGVNPGARRAHTHRGVAQHMKDGQG
jgi:hypothetical protein